MRSVRCPDTLNPCHIQIYLQIIIQIIFLDYLLDIILDASTHQVEGGQIMRLYTWDEVDRFENDPCGCQLCKRIQEAVRKRNPLKKMNAYYRLLEDMNGEVAFAEIKLA
jgi:hypothetical protein